MSSDHIVGIDLGTTNSLVAFMQGETPDVIRGEDIEQRIQVLEVSAMLDGEPSSWNDRYPIQQDIEKKLSELRREIKACHDKRKEGELWKRVFSLSELLERVRRV